MIRRLLVVAALLAGLALPSSPEEIALTREGARVVVATVGAVVGEDKLKQRSVGGVISQGMLCDAPMLGWVGGGAGAAALVPESFSPGDRPPERRPCMDGK